MIMKFDDTQMNGMFNDDEDFANYVNKQIIPKHAPSHSDVAAGGAANEMTIWGRRYAEHFGFKDPIYQIHFVVLMWNIGPDFFLFEPYKTILADRTQSEEVRIERCNLEPTMDQEWTAISQSKSDYWFPQYIKNNILGVEYDDIEEQFQSERSRQNGAE